MTVRSILVVSGASPFRLHLVLLSLENPLLLLIRAEMLCPLRGSLGGIFPKPISDLSLPRDSCSLEVGGASLLG